MDRSLQAPLFKEITGYMSPDGDNTRLADQELHHPVTAYTSEHIHESERRMMLTEPVIVGHASSLPKPGDFIAHSDCGVPILVVRQKDGGVKAFINACRHRGAKVCTGERGSARAFTCSYHGWTYQQDGALLRVPRDGFPNVDTARSGLVELACESRHGLIWVVPTPGIEIDVAKHLGPIDDELAQYPLDSYVLERDALIEENLNWKFILDGFLEIYHIPVLHRDSISPWFYGRFSPFDQIGRHGRLVGVKKSFQELKDKTFEDVGDIMRHVAVNYQIFPNTIVVWQQDHFEVWTAFPGATPRDCKVRIMSLVKPDMLGEEYRSRWDRNWKVLIDTVRGEDWAVCGQAQDALPYLKEQGLVFGRNEPGIQHFHATVTAELDRRSGSTSPETR
ncbi:MAG TPA: aromatic ring-hydroxylating dioxygenase subunit alpha [Amycolatopsis sp.]|nr:aromatic ring-hydroxylating dioxygenase subunit alpha [Amycolatopsis sp.]